MPMTVPNPAPLDALRKLIIDQKKANIPIEPPDATLADLHDAVAAYDRLVSQVVFGVIQNFPVTVSTADVLAAQEKLNQIMTQPETAGNPRAALYFKYQKRLDQMLDLAEQIRATGPA